MSSKLLPFPAVVELLGCSDGTLRSLDQELHPIRLRPRGKRFYRRDLIDDFLSQRQWPRNSVSRSRQATCPSDLSLTAPRFAWLRCCGQ